MIARDSVDSNWLLILVTAVLISVVTGWAAWSEIDMLARASGQIIATARTQIIQSSTDGVIEKVVVQEGERVKKGQLVVQLEKVQPEAAVQDSQSKVAALRAALSRLRAEVLGQSLAFDSDVLAYPTFVKNQTELFQRRNSALKAEIGAMEQSLTLVQQQLELSLPLLHTGDLGKSEIIALRKQIAELSGQITNRRNKFFQDAQAEMTKAEEELAAQEQLLIDRKAVFERATIYSPADGIVKNIQLTTPGARVRPGDVILEILPTGGSLVLEVKLPPADIAFVQAGLPASVKLDAYDYAIYGQLPGMVAYVSPDALIEKTNAGDKPYYRVQVQISGLRANSNELVSNATGKKILVQAGMTGSVDIRTGKQTILSYLTKPITKTWHSALHER